MKPIKRGDPSTIARDFGLRPQSRLMELREEKEIRKQLKENGEQYGNWKTEKNNQEFSRYGGLSTTL